MGRKGLNRRGFLKGMGALAAGGALSMMHRPKGIAEEGSANDNTRFLIVLSAAGGASIIDSLLAIRKSESNNGDLLNCFPDAKVQSFDGSPLRAVDLNRPDLGAIPASFKSNQSNFVRKHMQDIMAVTWERTSVNHFIGQRRSVTGNEIWQGRTMQELVALNYGEGFALPNVHLASGTGYVQRGTDDSLPTYCYGEPITDPALWPLALDGAKGFKREVPRGLLQRARQLRNEKLETSSNFHKVFGEANRLKHWRHVRGKPQETLEAQDLIRKLMLFPDSQKYPLTEHGLESSAGAIAARERFPNYAVDPLEAQAAMAFLLLKYRVSVTVTLGPSFDVVLTDEYAPNSGGGNVYGSRLLNPPIGFDFSHQGHRSVQALMWDRIYRVADGLIDLLKAEEYANGESMWDRTMIYVATDFGRTKNRPSNATEFATGHDLNNGVAVISPLVNGNTVLGGVDPNTGLTYGFNPSTGEEDRGRKMNESEIFGGLLQSLGIDTSEPGLRDMPSMRKA